jgi:Homeodomain-like domain
MKDHKETFSGMIPAGISPQEAARRMGVSVRTVYRYLKNETLEEVPYHRASERSVEDWVKKHYRPGGSFDLHREHGQDRNEPQSGAEMPAA